MNPELQQAILDLIKPHLPVIGIILGTLLAGAAAYLKRKFKFKDADIQNGRAAVDLMARAIEAGAEAQRLKVKMTDFTQAPAAVEEALKELHTFTKREIKTRAPNLPPIVAAIISEAAKRVDPKKKG